MSLRDCLSYLNTTNWHRVALFLFFALIGISYGVGISVASSNAKKLADEDYTRRLTLFTEWQMRVTSHFARAASLAASMAAFASSYATVPMNFSAPPMDRVVTINNPAYLRLCEGLFREVPGISTLELHSGGVISQIYPVGYFPIGMDIMNLPEDQGYGELLATGLPITAGPAKIFTGEYGIFLRYPVYVSDTKSNATFWGTGNVVMLIMDLLNALNISTLPDDHQMDYAGWYITERWGTTDILATTDESQTAVIMDKGMRMQLPVAEKGKVAYLALYPKGGPVTASISGGIMAVIFIVGLIGSALVVLGLYAVLYANFWRRHRFAPDPKKGTVFIAALSLRGAQPVMDRDGVEAVRMFGEFADRVRAMCHTFRAYAVCEVGDRCIYVVASDAEQLALFAQRVVSDVRVECRSRAHLSAAQAAQSPGQTTCANTTAPSTLIPQQGTISVRNFSIHGGATPTPRSGSNTPVQTPLNQSDTDGSTRHSGDRALYLNSLVCHVSAACHAAAQLPMAYDAARDLYFFGSAFQLAKLGAAADHTTGGEIAWTEAFNSSGCDVGELGEAAGTHSSRAVSERDRVVAYVGRWSRPMDDSERRCAEDPSTAMAFVADPYVKRMCATAGDSGGKKGSRRGKGMGAGLFGGAGAGAGEQKLGGAAGGRSSELGAATSISRNCTLLHISFSGDAHVVMEAVRRAVAEERGAIVSAHSHVIVAAFNLLAPGGHHQLRAAEVVTRLRSDLAAIPFASSIHSGRVDALVAEGAVICYGDAVTIGASLLDRAVLLSGLTAPMRTGRADFEPLQLRRSPLLRGGAETAPKAFAPERDTVVMPNTATTAVGAGGAATIRRRNSSKRSISRASASAAAAVAAASHGLCLLYCNDSLSTSYDCEAIDVMAPGGRSHNNNSSTNNNTNKQSATMPMPMPASTSNTDMLEALAQQQSTACRVLYRLGDRRQHDRGGNEDEWMYELQYCDSKNVYAKANAVFSRIAEGDFGDFEGGRVVFGADGKISFVDLNAVSPIGGHEKLSSGPAPASFPMSSFAQAALTRFASKAIDVAYVSDTP